MGHIKMKESIQSKNIILGISIMILGILGSILLGYGIIISEKIYELFGTIVLLIMIIMFLIPAFKQIREHRIK